MEQGDCQRPTFWEAGVTEEKFWGTITCRDFFVIINFWIEAVAQGDCRQTTFWEASVTEKNFLRGRSTYLQHFFVIINFNRGGGLGRLSRDLYFWGERHGKIFEGRSHTVWFFVIINFNRGECHGATVRDPLFEKASVKEKIFEGRSHTYFIFRDYQLQ